MDYRQNVINTYNGILKTWNRLPRTNKEAKFAVDFAKAVVGMSRVYQIPLKEFYS